VTNVGGKKEYKSLVPKMDQSQAMIKTMVLEEPSDFDVAARVARHVFKWNESAIAFAASSDASRVLFVEWVKQELRGGVV